MDRSMRAALCGIATLALAGCGDASGGLTGPSPEEVAGIYAVCALTFDPDGDLLADVDVVARGFEPGGQEIRAPQLQVDPTRDFQVVFTPKGQFVERTFIGTYLPAGTRLRLSFTGGTAAPASFLLPPTLDLTFQQTPKSLTTAATPAFEVDRADYARLAGVSESNLAPRIQGRLMAVFQAGGCS